MFTGLIQDVGTIAAQEHRGKTSVLHVATALAAELGPGDSVAVDGACLTVTAVENGGFTAFVSDTTAARTGLAGALPGRRVNLERALAVGGRLDGHFVTGHVDARVRLRRIDRHGDAVHLELALPPAPLDAQVVARGSVALDGISLTVTDVRDGGFGVTVIPHTVSHTTLQFRRVGDDLNIETDILAKYVHAALGGARGSQDGQHADISLDFLRETGFAR